MRRKYGLREPSAYVLFLQVPGKSSVFGSNVEDLQKTSFRTGKKDEKVPCPAIADDCFHLSHKKVLLHRVSVFCSFMFISPYRLIRCYLVAPWACGPMSIWRIENFSQFGDTNPSQYGEFLCECSQCGE